jgi:hypothetical protein
MTIRSKFKIQKMGSSSSRVLPPRPPVAEGKKRICVAGFTLSHHTNRARKIADAIVASQPEVYESWYFFDSKAYRDFLNTTIKPNLPDEQQKKFAAHKSSPFCWVESDDGSLDAKGGRDGLCEWALAEFPDTASVSTLAQNEPSLSEAWVDETPGTAPLS